MTFKVLTTAYKALHDLIILSVTCLTSPLTTLHMAPFVPATLTFLLPFEYSSLLLPQGLYTCYFLFLECSFFPDILMTGSLTFTRMPFHNETYFLITIFKTTSSFFQEFLSSFLFFLIALITIRVLYLLFYYRLRLSTRMLFPQKQQFFPLTITSPVLTHCLQHNRSSRNSC